MTDSALRAGLRKLGAAHDLTSQAGFALGTVVSGLVVLALCYEVASRYFAGTPTQWANPLSNFGLAFTVFIALPEVTRRGGHIAVDLLLVRAPMAVAAKMQRVILVVSSLAALVAGWLAGVEALSQFQQGVQTISAVTIPKWCITATIAFGLASAGLHFLRKLT